MLVGRVKTEIVIPARIGSTRLPNKMLLQAGGKSVLEWTYSRAKELGYPVRVITEDYEIVQEVRRFGGDVWCGQTQVKNGVDGIKNYVRALQKAHRDSNYSYTTQLPNRFVNLQGDCPLFDMKLLNSVIKRGNQKARTIITAYYKADNSTGIYNNPKYVKLVTAGDHAAYFSRSVIPYNSQELKIHIGIYNYPRYLIEQYQFMENSENLEQLFYLGQQIFCIQGSDTLSIDTQEDFDKFKEMVK
jgi:3-deoxy-manno-octulosonate cytidylyltransferase (CMP-KDO synthetase)